ncbi:Erythromycin resistance leader peptide [Micromonospora inositola]|uniref:Erythromycin resistance leader peptide n=1 Tax=Micromonospora inositola TaxID=47865 RepID=A0A1C5J2G1_9ACTN|nr:Erythromycin resistance leader peptide [Micromonospora inositola]
MTPPTHLPAGAGAERSGAVLSRLQLLVTRKLDGLLQGDYAGLLPGPGSEAGESREYRPGDDVRRMDWPVTARTTMPHVRRTVADRELETWLAVDLSASLDFGTGRWLKRDVVVAAAAALAHLTVRGGNRIGAVVGTGAPAPPRAGRWRGAPPAAGPGTLRRLPARAGRKEAQGLLRAIAEAEIQPGRSDLGALVDMLNRPPRRRGVAVVISDFLAPPQQWGRPIRKLRVRHDVLAIEVVDPRELELPDVGVLPVVDPETGELHEVQTADPRLRRRYADAAAAQRAAIAAELRAAGAAHLRLRTDRDWLLDMVRFVAAQRHARTRGTTR